MTSKKRLIFSYGILALLLAVLFAANPVSYTHLALEALLGRKLRISPSQLNAKKVEKAG